ncbi:DUF6461 domain-containing protein [Sphaerisporangium sp. NPDC051017]|uniref:DUF6461 domain-containing protein n=1 Tax=Sphaerisporangium sp. NPDC051017 TaxID=3154636 RepID=UPI003427AA16
MAIDKYSWITADHFSGLWISGFSVIFVTGVSEESIRERLGLNAPVDSGSMQTSGGPFVAALHTVNGGVLLVERAGYAGMLQSVVGILSTDTTIAAVSLTSDDIASFVYAVDGEVVTVFDIYDSSLRRGSDEDALSSEISEVNLTPSDEDQDEDDDDFYDKMYEFRQAAIPKALLLASRLTHLWVQEAYMTEAYPRYSLSDFYLNAEGVPPALV